MTLRVGVVGTGYWAEVVHAAGVAAHPDVELAGVWGRDRVKAAALAEPFGAASYDDFDELLADVDALTFAVPPMVQAPLAIKAAEAGRHLLLEKPIATDLATAERLAAAAAGVSTVVFFTGRFMPSWEDWFTEQCKHSWLSGRAEWLESIAPDSPFATPWREEYGSLWDVGPHALCYLLPALGPVASVTGARGLGNLVHLVLTHHSGATSVMSLSQSMPPTVERVSVELYGDAGLSARPDEPRDVGACYARALGELMENIRAGRTEHRCDVRFGRDVVEVLARCQVALGPTPPSDQPTG